VWVHAGVLQSLNTHHSLGYAAVHHEKIVGAVIAGSELGSKDDPIDLLEPPGLGQGLWRHVPVTSSNPRTFEASQCHSGNLKDAHVRLRQPLRVPEIYGHAVQATSQHSIDPSEVDPVGSAIRNANIEMWRDASPLSGKHHVASTPQVASGGVCCGEGGVPTASSGLRLSRSDAILREDLRLLAQQYVSLRPLGDGSMESAPRIAVASVNGPHPKLRPPRVAKVAGWWAQVQFSFVRKSRLRCPLPARLTLLPSAIGTSGSPGSLVLARHRLNTALDLHQGFGACLNRHGFVQRTLGAVASMRPLELGPSL